MNNIMFKTCLFCLALFLFGCGAESGAGGSSGGGNSGSGGNGGESTSQSGSTAAMLNYQDALYILDFNRLDIFDISSTEDAVLVNSIKMTQSETLFVYKDNLYIGGQIGDVVYDISDPFNPVRLSSIAHVRGGCDPIIVHDDIAYITVRTGQTGFCQSTIDNNSLSIVDFSEPTAPIRLISHKMTFPYGLAKVGDYIAVCQEDFGLTLVEVDITEGESGKSAAVKEIASYPQIGCFDLIFSSDILIATASDGIYQFGVSDFLLNEISVIPVGENEG